MVFMELIDMILISMTTYSVIVAVPISGMRD